MTEETQEIRLKRLAMRCWRRGTKEMDLILGPFADTELATLDDDALGLFEAFASEEDHDLYGWIIGTIPPPPHYAAMAGRVAAFARARHTPGV